MQRDKINILTFLLQNKHFYVPIKSSNSCVIDQYLYLFHSKQFLKGRVKSLTAYFFQHHILFDFIKFLIKLQISFLWINYTKCMKLI